MTTARKPRFPKRGDIIFIDFNPVSGHEQGFSRPALVLSPTAFNEKIELALVAPITSTVRGHGFEVTLQETKTKGVVLCHQTRTIDFKARKYKHIEVVPDSTINEALAKVRLLVT